MVAGENAVAVYENDGKVSEHLSLDEGATVLDLAVKSNIAFFFTADQRMFAFDIDSHEKREFPLTIKQNLALCTLSPDLKDIWAITVTNLLLKLSS